VRTSGCDARRALGGRPLTVVCCDNLPHNGRVVGSIVHAFADAIDPGLDGWIRDNVTFPSTMVDRIVPATTPQDVQDAANLTGLHDAASVVSEPYFEWVMEDRFAAGRPSWDAVGVKFASDVAPFETMKLRYLN